MEKSRTADPDNPGDTMRKKLFLGKFPPACEYCEHGRKASDNLMILCIKKGVVSPHYACRRFVYSPLKRVPHRQPKLPTFSPEEFLL